MNGSIVTAVMSHTFMERCEVIQKLSPIMVMSTLAMFGVFIAWLLCVFRFRKDQVFIVQKMLCFLPFCKAMELIVLHANVMACPWVNTDMAT